MSDLIFPIDPNAPKNTASVTVLRIIAFDAIDKESQDQALKGE